MTVVEDTTSNALSLSETLHRHPTSILATGTRAPRTSAINRLTKRNTLTMRVSAFICTLFLIHFNQISCEKVNKINSQPPVHYISNVPFISLNTTVFKIVEDRSDQNPSFIVGARNFILRVTSSLAITDNNENGPLMDNERCTPLDVTTNKCPQTVMKDQDNHVIIINYDTIPTPKVISCGTVRQGMCVIYHANQLSRGGGFIGNPIDNTNYVASIKSTQYSLAFPVTGNRTSTTYMTGHEYDGRPVEFSPPALSLRKITVIPFPAIHYLHLNASNLRSSIEIDRQLKTSYRMKFIYGFHDEKYIYVLSNQKASLRSNDLEARVGRICINDYTLRSYTEVPIACNWPDHDTSREYNVATAAFSASHNGSSQYFFFAMSATESGKMDGIRYEYGSVVCGISLDKLNQHFDRMTEQCFMANQDETELHPAFNKVIGGSNQCTKHRMAQTCGESTHNPYILGKNVLELEPLLHLNKAAHITSLTTYTEKSTTVALIGTSKGQIMKAVLDSKSEVLFEKDFAEPTYVPEFEKQIRPDPVLNKDKSYAMFLTCDRIVKFPTNSCAIYSTCASCIQTRDPLGCGWCSGKCASSSECATSTSQTCSPVIHQFSPKSGPKEGGTEITINGDNFGHSQAGTDPIKVSIIEKGDTSASAKSKTCDVKEWGNEKITCITQPSFDFDLGNIQVKVRDYSRKVGNYTIEGTVRSNEEFAFVTPSVESVEPLYGPFSGGVGVSISGLNLDIGTKRQVFIVDPNTKSTLTECQIVSVLYSSMECETQKYDGNLSNGSVVVKFDNKQITTSFQFIFKKDPVVTHVFPTAATVSSRMSIKISGHNLDSIAKPAIKFDKQTINCNLMGQNIICTLPLINKLWGDPSHEKQKMPFALFNGEYRVQKQPDKLQFTFYPDPKIYPLSTSDAVFLDDNILELRGANLSTEYPINITLGHDDFYCKPIFCDSNRLKCEIQFDKTLPSPNDVLNVRYTIGQLDESLGEVAFRKRISNGVSPVYIVLACFIIALVIALFVYFFVRKSKTKEKDGLVIFTNNEQSMTSNEYANTSRDSDSEVRPLMNPLRRLDEETIALFAASNKLIAREYLQCGDLVGKGHFGKVFKGFLEKPGEQTRKEVAIKTLQHFTSYEEMDSFLREACIMKDFNHQNVMTLIGLVFPEEDTPLLILPFMCNGDLLQYVRDENREPRVRELLKFALDIAYGMEYLAQQKFVHRDLAARNCMLDENLNVCVADFGLSRDVYEKGYYRPNQRTPLPYKWMAPESIKMFTFTTKSDVWSYAVTSWELITRGFIPYAGVNNFELEEYLDQGRRLEKPAFCPDAIYNLWQRCWSDNPSLRPTFADIVKEIQDFMSAVDAAALATKIPSDAIYRNVGGRYYNEKNYNPESEASSSNTNQTINQSTATVANNFTQLNKPRMQEPTSVENSSL